MNTHRRIYTWVDVEETVLRAFEGDVPSWCQRAHVYWDSLTLEVTPGTPPQAVWDWLGEVFGEWWEGEEPRGIRMDRGMGQPPALLTVEVETLDSPPGERHAPPTFRRALSVTVGAQGILAPDPRPEDAPPLFAFHSFKGGVGRTTQAIALALALRDALGERKVLLVDGDLEAPGLSWIFEPQLPAAEIAYSDLLALLHSDPEIEGPSALETVRSRIQSMVVQGIFVLPAFRGRDRWQLPVVRPEDLVSARTPFRLSDALTRLAMALGVGAVVLDLRAGLSELSAPFLLDPRAERVLVTTASGQSVEGTCQILDRIRQLQPGVHGDPSGDTLPKLVLSMVHQGQDRPIREARERLTRAFVNYLPETSAQDEALVEAPFDQELAQVPLDGDVVCAHLRRMRLPEAFKSLVAGVRSGNAALQHSSGDLNKARRKLEVYAAQVLYAEHAVSEQFLSTPPLKELAAKFREALPTVIVIGAKGAGKTFGFLQLVRVKTWERFTDEVEASAFGDRIESPPAVEGRRTFLLPVLASVHLAPAVLAVVESTTSTVREALGFDRGYSLQEVREKLQQWVAEPATEVEWARRWLDLAAMRLGAHSTSGRPQDALFERLGQGQDRVILLLDGLEDSFQHFYSDDQEQKALGGLLRELPVMLQSRPGVVPGLLAFVREDLVVASVKQNVAQLRSLYDRFALRWRFAEALELVVWLASQSKVLPDTLQAAPLDEQLRFIWGAKMGSDRSKEARTSSWVLGVLSDFNEGLQARDLVRLVRFAARLSSDLPSEDRLLSPNAMRRALELCGPEKLEEIRVENSRLGDTLGRLRDLAEADKLVPLPTDSQVLSVEDRRLLEDAGVLTRETEGWYMPEIYRHMLGFRLASGRRARVISMRNTR